MSRRVVVTGLGCITPIGHTVRESWRNLLASKSGIIPITELENYNNDYRPFTKYIPPKVAVGKVPPFSKEIKELSDALITSQEERKYSQFIKLSILTSYEALKDADLLSTNSSLPNPAINTSLCNLDRFGCIIGSGIGSIGDIYSTSLQFHENDPKKKISPFFIPKILTNMAAGNVSIKFNLRGPSHSVSTACATGNNAIGDAYNFIKLGMQDICIAGASESSILPLSLAGFLRAKSITPDGISRPFDIERNGFVLGEGSGMLVLESLEHAQNRGAKIYCELKGYGLSCDAYHITSPSPSGDGAKRAMEMALSMSDIEIYDIDYVNAHATSTQLGDSTEIEAIISALIPPSRVNPLYISSNKGSVGHQLGAAGAVESIFTILSLRNGIIPHTLNLKNQLHLESIQGNPDTLSFVKGVPSRPKKLEYALSNSFGFGGVNTSLLFKKWEQC
ncbi:fatty acid synthase CEM1 NDAI_0E04790 [Naumovozyma dairenensis CBS 421]|uniref:3-oxoacyl-[acyl-carrier-protein] synthase n=1 Tax=Naumovozyma dairenensis (strain ATCC 10597 / BCRC 20456 / CBS 421 / NBRC 0211 / NRRL Y-12639) TaxID=1071378 RepID=G0WAM3_NAUDC|nr:hypothetical protein NDAI_0E04790 [Naumovozyma dairenensis CBS 421]CCD25296.1 hypothetical protein NDAI_0E04790 [Naumovozyma dairenensis CBS 421]